MHRLRGFMRNLNIVEISQAQSLITVLSSRCFWRCWIATLILEGRWLMEIANIFRCSRENKTATACQRITQGNSEQNQSQFNFVDAPCVGGPRGCRTKTWFQPRPRERSIDRDYENPITYCHWGESTTYWNRKSLQSGAWKLNHISFWDWYFHRNINACLT